VTNEIFVAAIMATLLGSLLGFLFFNFNPARIFMGDSGSYFIGFVLGTMSLAGSAQKTSTAVSLLVPILALGVPIFDTLLTMIRRFLEGRPIFSPDRGHIHHRLLDMGLTHRRVVLILYGTSLVLTCAAIGVSLGSRWTVGLALLVACVAVVALVRFVGYFDYVLQLRRQRAPVRTQDTEKIRRALPLIVQALAAARSEGAVLKSLTDWAPSASLGSLELLVADSEEVVLSWGAAPWDHDAPDVVCAQYAVGEDALARTRLRIRWASFNGELDPQSEVLLQVVADVLGSALDKVESKYAPAPGRVEERALRPAVLPAGGREANAS
jgi:UDP-GlcNAc:undecaprenyl-phosphate GlcNAc-1-phosphate transferase